MSNATHQDLPRTFPSRPVGVNGSHGELHEQDSLGAENVALRQRVEELEELLASAANNWADDGWAERQREYENLLEEKSEVIRTLHQKVQELQEAGDAPAPSSSGGAEAHDLKELRQQVAEERQQLQADEEAMMKQMQQMELAMSRERADLARQRAELQRLHADLNHELEQAARDPGLRERLLSLQRRQQEMASRRAAAAQPQPAAPEKPAQTPPESAPAAAQQKSNGFLRRLFG
jgi:hypothetical protein